MTEDQRKRAEEEKKAILGDLEAIADGDGAKGGLTRSFQQVVSPVSTQTKVGLYPLYGVTARPLYAVI